MPPGPPEELYRPDRPETRLTRVHRDRLREFVAKDRYPGLAPALDGSMSVDFAGRFRLGVEQIIRSAATMAAPED
ncbi:hypothetical protein AB0I49_26815 [Streptomyces sp. NPDC050617]|uniref:hypothetical protein n=1 Tax=Streptomyces sp. NPDC050617 TaxID=3154628 RepID=UPI0034122A0C